MTRSRDTQVLKVPPLAIWSKVGRAVMVVVIALIRVVLQIAGVRLGLSRHLLVVLADEYSRMHKLDVVFIVDLAE
jgi:hypothetical protein